MTANRPANVELPSPAEIIAGCEAFEQHEKRDAMYRVASFLVDHHWGKPSDMADGLGVLLLTWNQAFYRYGSFDFDALEKCIRGSLSTLDGYRNRDILSLLVSDEQSIKTLFGRFLEALKVTSKVGVRRSPVAVAKALHILAPAFFPLWDDKIAKNYGCHYSYQPDESYIDFCWKTKAIAEEVGVLLPRSGKSIIKRIDEYNYAKYTQGWV